MNAWLANLIAEAEQAVGHNWPPLVAAVMAITASMAASAKLMLTFLDKKREADQAERQAWRELILAKDVRQEELFRLFVREIGDSRAGVQALQSVQAHAVHVLDQMALRLEQLSKKP